MNVFSAKDPSPVSKHEAGSRSNRMDFGGIRIFAVEPHCGVPATIDCFWNPDIDDIN